MVEAAKSTISKKCWQIDRSLLPTKTFYFFFLSAASTLLPFISIYLKQLGLTSAETGIIYGIIPFAGFFVQLIAGVVADKLRRHKIVLMSMCLVMGAGYMCLLLVPGRHEHPTSNFSINIHCNAKNSFITDCDTESPWIYFRTQYANQQTGNATVYDIDCNTSCTVAYKDNNATHANRICFTSGTEVLSENCEETWILSSTDAISRVNFSLSVDGGWVEQELMEVEGVQQIDSECREYTVYKLRKLTFNGQPFTRMLCKEKELLNCQMACDHSPISNNTKMIYDMTFWLSLIILVLASNCYGPSLSLNDAIAYDNLGKNSGKWGRQRMWGTIGYAAFSIVSTLAMDLFSEQHSVNYKLSFYIFGVQILISVLVSGFLQVSPNLVCLKMSQNVFKLLINPEVTLFCLSILIFGIYKGVIEAFLFWYLLDLQKTYTGHASGNAIILGLCLVLNCTLEVPLLFFSGSVIKRLGEEVCLYLAFFAYVVRFLGYSFLANAWYVLLLEPFHGLTYGLMWAGATSYAFKITPPGTSATAQALIGGLHTGFGKGIGALLTGFLFKTIKPVWTFRLYAISSLVFLLLYFILQTLWLKKRNAKPSHINSVIMISGVAKGPTDRQKIAVVTLSHRSLSE